MKNELRACGLLLLTAAIWGFAMATQRAGAQYLSPFTFNACRFTLGSLVMLPLMIRENKKTASPLKKREIIPGLLLAAVLFLASLLQQTGLGGAGAGKAGFLTALYVVLVPVLGVFVKKKTGLFTWLSLLIALPALYLLCVPAGEAFSLNGADTLLLAGAVFWALHILLTDHFVLSVAPIKLCMVQFAVGAAGNWICALLLEPVTWDGLFHALGPVLYCGILSTGVGYLLQTVGQKGCRPALAALILSLESVFCVIAGALLLGERMDARGYLGCGLMLLAVVTAQAGAFLPARKEIYHV